MVPLDKPGQGPGSELAGRRPRTLSKPREHGFAWYEHTIGSRASRSQVKAIPSAARLTESCAWFRRGNDGSTQGRVEHATGEALPTPGKKGLGARKKPATAVEGWRVAAGSVGAKNRQ